MVFKVFDILLYYRSQAFIYMGYLSLAVKSFYVQLI